MNCIILSGEIINVKKVETANGYHARFVLSVPYTYPTGKTYYNRINCTAFSQICDYIINKLGVGSMINIQGRWLQTSFKDNDGKWNNSSVCVVEHLEVLKTTEPEELPDGVNAYNTEEVDDQAYGSEEDLDGVF